MSLWQKPEQEQNRSTTTTTPKPHVTPSTTHGENRMSKPANIGQSVQINGELTGQEDLIIDGKIDGKIMLKDHQLTIGPNGHINAEVHAKSVQINGEVQGNITADDKVEVSATGSMLAATAVGAASIRRTAAKKQKFAASTAPAPSAMM